MFQVVITQIKARLDIAMKSAACAVIAAIAALIAVAFFAAAGFIALAERYGTINTCLMFGGAFVVIAAVTFTILTLLKRRAARTKVNIAQAIDPQALAAGAEIYRLFGGRKAASMGLVGAFIIGILLSRSVPRK